MGYSAGKDVCLLSGFILKRAALDETAPCQLAVLSDQSPYRVRVNYLSIISHPLLLNPW